MNDSLPPTTPGDDALRRDMRALELALARTREALEGPLLLECVLWYLTSCGAVLLSALLMAAILPSGGRLFPTLSMIGLAAATLVAATLAITAWRQRLSLIQTARHVQRHDAQWRHDLVAALKFGQALTDGSFDAQRASPLMAREHVRKTAARVLQHQGHLVDGLPGRDFTPALSALAGTALLLLLAAIFAPSSLTRDVSASLEQALTLESSKQAPEYPVLGNLNLTLTPPSYTNMEARFETLTTGNATVLSGTQVHLQGYVLLGRAVRVELVVTQPGEQTPQVHPMELSESGRASASLVVSSPLQYSFQARLDDGTLVKDPVLRTLSVVPDEAPTIALTSHQGELAVSTQDVLELEFQVSDDFGIAGVTRLHAFTQDSEKPERLVLEAPELQSAPLEHTGKHVLDLSTLGLQPKDRVTLWLEASDNNTLTGPGVGRSAAIVLYVASPDDKHMQNMEAQRALVEALLMSLADFLESPLGTRVSLSKERWRQLIPGDLSASELSTRHARLLNTHTTHGEVLTVMSALAARLSEDPLMSPRDLKMFTALHVQLAALHKRGEGLLEGTREQAAGATLTPRKAQPVASWAMETEIALEKGILRMEDLLLSQQMESAKQTAEEIEALKERLKELLLKYKETGDPALKQAIKREIQRLRQRMQELMQRMNSQLREMPSEHLNREAIEQAKLESEAKQLADDFNSIEELLDKDDIDGALEALERMSQGLDKLTEDLDKSADAAKPKSLSEFDKKVGELMDDVNDLNMRQQELEQKTRELQQQFQESRRQENQEMLEDFVSKMKREAARQREDIDRLESQPLPEHLRPSLRKAKESVRKLEESLEQQDIEGSLENAQQMQEDMDRANFSMNLSKRYTKSNSKEARQIRDALQKTQPILERGERMLDDLEGVMEEAEQQASRPDPRAQKLSKQQQDIEQQAQRLEQKIQEASEQFPQLKSELSPSMERANEAMGEAKDALGEQRAQRALDAERKALQELRNMSDAMKESLQRKRNEEQRGAQQSSRDRQEVKIPGQAEGGKKSRYRDEIQDTMKEERLDDYSSEIERYYKSLVE